MWKEIFVGVLVSLVSCNANLEIFSFRALIAVCTLPLESESLLILGDWDLGFMGSVFGSNFLLAFFAKVFSFNSPSHR